MVRHSNAQNGCYSIQRANNECFSIPFQFHHRDQQHMATTSNEPVVDVESLIQIEDGISLDQLKQVNDAFEVHIKTVLCGAYSI